MRDHRGPGAPIPSDITALVEAHRTKHPGSVKRTPKAKARAAAKRQRASRRTNR